MREVAEGEAIFEALENLAENEFDPDMANEVKEKTKEKLKRYKAIMTKKTGLQKKTEQNVKQLDEQISRLKNDAVLREEVLDNKEISLNEKDKEIEDMLKEKKKIKEKHDKLQQENTNNLHKLQKENGQLVKDKQDLKFEIENQKSLITILKEKAGDVDYEEEEPEVQVTARVVMDKEISANKCTACNKTFNKNEDLERHMNAKHTEKQCILCEKVCDSERELINHQAICVDQGVQTVSCKKCKKNYTNYGIKRHEPHCHGEEKFVCPKCGQTEKTARDIKNHMQEDHEERRLREKSREVCWHWRQGNCFRGNSCNFSHVGHQKRVNSTRTNESSTQAGDCHNGPSCQWKQQGQCRYFHQGVGVQKPQRVQGLHGRYQEVGGNHGAHQPRAHRRQLCRWNEQCFRKETCKFEHTSNRGFPQNQRNQHRPIQRSLGCGHNQRRN